MPRKVSVTFSDGSQVIYEDVPDNVQPHMVVARAEKENGKDVTEIDGGAGDEGLVGSVTDDRPNDSPPHSPPHSPPPMDSSTLGTLGRSTVNTLAGLAQGAAALPDMATNALGSLMSYGARGIGAAGGMSLRALGSPGAAADLEGTMNMAAKGFAKPVTLGGLVEGIAPTPQDSTGQTVRTISQLAGGMVSPANRFLPQPAAKPVTFASMANQQIVGDAGKAGVRVMTSDLKPPQTFIGKVAQSTGERIPFFGTGGPRQAQQAERIAATKGLLADYGAFSESPAVDNVAADLLERRGKVLQAFTKAKTAVINQAPGAVPVSGTINAIDQQIAGLQRIGTDATKPVIAKLKDWRQAIQGKDLQTIEQIRKEMGAAFTAPELSASRDTGEKALSAIYAPMRDDMGKHIQATLGAGARSRWAHANEQLSAMAGELNNGTLKSVLRTGEMTPENVAKLLFSAKPSDVRLIYSGLSATGRARAQTAIMQRVLEKSGGAEALSAERFANAVRNQGKSIGVFFEGPDGARLQGLVRVLNSTRRAAGASVAPPTGVQAVPFAMGAGLTGALGLAGGATAGAGLGLLARAYESAPVRDLLLQVSKTPAGSKQEAALLTKIMSAISATEQRPAVVGMNDNVGVAVAASDRQKKKENQ